MYIVDKGLGDNMDEVCTEDTVGEHMKEVWVALVEMNKVVAVDMKEIQ